MIRWNAYRVHKEVEELKSLIEETRPAMEKLEKKIEQIKRFPHIPQYIADPLNSFKYEISHFYRRTRSSIERIEKNLPKDELERQRKRYEFVQIRLPEPEREGQANFFGEVVPLGKNQRGGKNYDLTDVS